jgi:hypothetical protein
MTMSISHKYNKVLSWFVHQTFISKNLSFKDHELRHWKHKFLKRLDMYHELMNDEKEKANIKIKAEDFTK